MHLDFISTQRRNARHLNGIHEKYLVLLVLEHVSFTLGRHREKMLVNSGRCWSVWPVSVQPSACFGCARSIPSRELWQSQRERLVLAFLVWADSAHTRARSVFRPESRPGKSRVGCERLSRGMPGCGRLPSQLLSSQPWVLLWERVGGLLFWRLPLEVDRGLGHPKFSRAQELIVLKMSSMLGGLASDP